MDGGARNEHGVTATESAGLLDASDPMSREAAQIHDRINSHSGKRLARSLKVDRRHWESALWGRAGGGSEGWVCRWVSGWRIRSFKSIKPPCANDLGPWVGCTCGALVGGSWSLHCASQPSAGRAEKDALAP